MDSSSLSAAMADDSREEAMASVHIHDLPDECLVEIMYRLGSVCLPNRELMPPDLTVEQPLHCALVCKRWLSLADDAVQSVHLSGFTKPFAEKLGTRFTRLTSLRVSGGSIPGSLQRLAFYTPHLTDLQLKPGFEPSISATVDALSRWTNLHRLDLGPHLCSRSPEDIRLTLEATRKLPSLRHLSFTLLSDADLPSACTPVTTLTSLSTLEITCADIPPPSPSSILRKLTLREFEGTEMPCSLGLLTRLEELCIERASDLTSLPESLGSLSLLTTLEVIDCKKLASLPASLGQLSALKSLEVRRCSAMEMWPGSLGELPALRRLLLSDCGDLPLTLGPLTGLENLWIYSFNRLPEDVGDLPSLRKLQLFQAPTVSELPSSLGQLSRLQVLRLDFFPSLAQLPEALGELTALRELEVRKCSSQLVALPESLGRLTRMEGCKISHLPRLGLLPESVREWGRLRELQISYCGALRALPQGLGRLRELELLHVEECPSLIALPWSLGQLSSLQVLRVWACKRLMNLPPTVEDLSALQLLQVMECRALELPRSLRRIRGLRIDQF